MPTVSLVFPVAMGTGVLIAALGIAVLSAAGAAVAIWRVRDQADRRVAAAIAEVAAGMQETIREMTVAMEAGRPAPAAERFPGELAASLDLDEVTGRTLEAAGGIPGVEAATLEAAGPDGSRLNASIGMPADEAARAAVQLPENDNLRAVEITYRYRLDDAEGAAPLVRSGIVVPLRADGESIGTLSAFSRSGQRALGQPEIDELERLAFRAGPALHNARRYTEARALADMDALTSLHNRRYFHETLAREVARAHRYDRLLSVVVFDLDDFKNVNDRIGHLAGDAVLAEVAERMLSVVRSADFACRVGGDEFGLVLPEASGHDAELLAQRIAEEISSRPVGAGGTIYVSAGVAELYTGDRPNDVFERADEALYRAKELGKARTVISGNAS